MHLRYWWSWKFWLFKLNLTLKVMVNHSPKTIRILTKVVCTSGPNLVTLAWMGDELWCRQAQNEVNLHFDLKFDLEGHGRSLHKTIGTLTKLFCIFGPNFVILAWNGSQVIKRTSKWLTHRLTDTQTQATTIPEGQNWPRHTMDMLWENWSFSEFHLSIWNQLVFNQRL